MRAPRTNAPRRPIPDTARARRRVPANRKSRASARLRKASPSQFGAAALLMRKERVEEENRQPEPEKVEGLELLPGAPPARDHRPGEAEKKERRIGREMLAEKSEELERMETGRVLEAAAGSEVREGDPGVLRIPDDRRNRAEREDEEEEVKIWPNEFATQAAGRGGGRAGWK